MNTAQNDTGFNVLRLLALDPDLNQRDLANALGISLGKVNQCVRELKHNGWVSASHYRDDNQRKRVRYLVTESGQKQRQVLAFRSLESKQRAFEQLRDEIQQLTEELQHAAGKSAASCRRKDP